MQHAGRRDLFGERALLRDHDRRGTGGGDVRDGVLSGMRDYHRTRTQIRPGIVLPSPRAAERDPLDARYGGVPLFEALPGQRRSARATEHRDPDGAGVSRDGPGTFPETAEATHIGRLGGVSLQPGRCIQLARPRGDYVVRHVVRNPVDRVVALARHRDHDRGDTHQAHERGDLDRYVDNHRPRARGANPVGERRHPRPESRVLQRRPVQCTAGGGISRCGRGVVPVEMNDLAKRVRVFEGERSERDDRCIEPTGESPCTGQVPATVVVHVVPDHATDTPCSRRAALRLTANR